MCFLVFQVEDATKALDATNGTTLEKNGQILRVAYAKSILGPGSGPSGSSQSSSLAAAAIEAAAFSQQVCAEHKRGHILCINISRSIHISLYDFLLLFLVV